MLQAVVFTGDAGWAHLGVGEEAELAVDGQAGVGAEAAVGGVVRARPRVDGVSVSGPGLGF